MNKCGTSLAHFVSFGSLCFVARYSLGRLRRLLQAAPLRSACPKNRKSFDKYMKNHVQNNYKGEYIFFNIEDINTERFNDRDKYRYALVQRSIPRTKRGVNSVSGKYEVYGYNTNTFQVIDRKEGKFYHGNVTSSSFAKLIDAYTINLEKVRLQNQSK